MSYLTRSLFLITISLMCWTVAHSEDADAESLFKRAIEIQEEKLGMENPELARTLKEYALLLHKLQRETEAAKLEARAKAIKNQQSQ